MHSKTGEDPAIDVIGLSHGPEQLEQVASLQLAVESLQLLCDSLASRCQVLEFWKFATYAVTPEPLPAFKWNGNAPVFFPEFPVDSTPPVGGVPDFISHYVSRVKPIDAQNETIALLVQPPRFAIFDFLKFLENFENVF